MILKICPQYSEDPITTQSKLNHQPLLTTTSTTPLEFTMLSTSKTIQKRGGEKPYGCRLCAYSSAFSDHLNTHMLTHTGEKPFSCKQCEYKCTAKGTLKTHMLTHSGEKPFTCMQCEFSCTTADNLKKHIVVFTTRFRLDQ